MYIPIPNEGSSPYVTKHVYTQSSGEYQYPRAKQNGDPKSLYSVEITISKGTQMGLVYKNYDY